ncbi:hypothetical protein [Bartonella tribocorum]|uniref:Hypothetical prophage protein n=1 Tax=Bartonella tribocorum (strain DSM 28219 / CCUG 45778 / CIP 105476 / IBS 506) TaxID=382640 RepID=A9IT07_BART1|nr:hypothetical protein [Bartonella tribocorum]CAK01365.1 hypothetical prophage protein [Bartonella tribocorum CIP 105476]
MMQELIKIFLTGLLSFIGSLSVALILRNKDRKEAAKIRKDDLEKAAKKREEDREWISKQFAESQEQTTALKEQAQSIKDLAKWSEEHIRILLRPSRRYLEWEACTDIIDRKSGLLYGELTLKVRNLTKKDILIKNIQITEHCSFEFLENACRFDEGRSDKWRSDLSKEKDPVVIKRTTPKRISLDPKEVKSNATLSFTLDLFRITDSECIVLYFLLSISESEYNAHNIVNCTLEYTSPKNPDELITDYFWALETPYKHLYCD